MVILDPDGKVFLRNAVNKQFVKVNSTLQSNQTPRIRLGFFFFLSDFLISGCLVAKWFAMGCGDPKYLKPDMQGFP